MKRERNEIISAIHIPSTPDNYHDGTLRIFGETQKETDQPSIAAN